MLVDRVEEREGFEPPGLVGLPLSRRVHLSALPPFRCAGYRGRFGGDRYTAALPLERCRSGRTGRPAKALTIARWSVGSNPTLSAIASPHVGPVTSMLRFDDEGCRPMCFLLPGRPLGHRTDHDRLRRRPRRPAPSRTGGTGPTTWSSTTARRRCRTTRSARSTRGPHTIDRVAGVDPRLVRIGAVAAVAVLMIPVAVAVRDDGGGDLRTTTATVASTLPVAAGRAASRFRSRRPPLPPRRRWSSEPSEDDVEVATAVRQSPHPSRQRAPAPTPSSSTTSGTASRSRRVPPSRSGWPPTRPR